MKASALAREFAAGPAVAKGACPICGVLKEFRSTLADNIQIVAAVKLDNFHTWLLARWAAAQNVARFSLQMLKRSSLAKVGRLECDSCRYTLQAETARTHTLEQRAPQKTRPVIREIVERTRSQLQPELGTFLEQAVQGTHAGALIPDRATEFLVGQRGL